MRLFDRNVKQEHSVPGCGEEFTIDLSFHRLQYNPGGSTLVVSFDNAARTEKEAYDGRRSWGEAFYIREGHSVLGIIARQADWYRQPDLIQKLEQFSKQGFFQEFDKVVLTGGSMGGFAAMAFAPLVPGCTVIAFSPQSTLKPSIARIETRFPKSRHQNWALPYSDAAFSVTTAGKAYIIYDNLLHLDRWHVERLAQAPHVLLLPIPGCGHGGTPVINQTGFFKEITRGMIAGQMTARRFHRLMRQRRRSIIYYLTLTDYAQKRGHILFLSRIRNFAITYLRDTDLQQIDARILEVRHHPIYRREHGTDGKPLPGKIRHALQQVKNFIQTRL